MAKTKTDKKKDSTPKDKKETKEAAVKTKSATKPTKNIPSAVFKDMAYEKVAKNAGNDVDKLEALTKGYDSPAKFSFGGYNAKSYQPDAVAHYKDHLDVYSLEGESSKKAIAKNLGKWILFSLEAKKGRGTFYIVTTKACFKAIDEIISAKQINAELITVD